MTLSITPQDIHKRIIVAIDTSSMQEAQHLVETLKGRVGAFKFGLQFFNTFGREGVEKLMESVPEKDGIRPLFLDLKFHDIPNTVKGGMHAVSPLAPFMTTIHLAGSEAMAKAAKDAAQNFSVPPMVLGVTLLTSMNEEDLHNMGIDSKESFIKNMVLLAQKAKIDGLICAPEDIQFIKNIAGDTLKLVVPGIRPKGSQSDDQKRTKTPKEALNAGADYLVIGRPITAQEDPIKALESILEDIKIS